MCSRLVNRRKSRNDFSYLHVDDDDDNYYDNEDDESVSVDFWRFLLLSMIMLMSRVDFPLPVRHLPSASWLDWVRIDVGVYLLQNHFLGKCVIYVVPLTLNLGQVLSPLSVAVKSIWSKT